MEQNKTSAPNPTLEGLQQEMGYHFSNLDLLCQALTHRSCLQDGQNSLASESSAQPGQDSSILQQTNLSCDTKHTCDRTAGHNERLEFLGDAVLELAISDLLFHRYPEQPEGALSHWRSSLVNTQSLGRIGQDYQLGHFLKMGRGEALSGGRGKVSILGNAVEALLGAIYLDGGYTEAYKAVRRMFSASLNEFRPGEWEKDYKSMLQERLQGDGLELPYYQVVTLSGAPHERIFQVACTVQGGAPGHAPISGVGIGRSKRMAEQSAAKEVLATLHQEQTLRCAQTSIHDANEHRVLPEQHETGQDGERGLSA